MEHKDKPQLSMVVMGHVDSGKSTFTGHLLYKLGVISEHVMKRVEKDCITLSKSSFKFACALSDVSHCDFGKDLVRVTFETEQRQCTIVDHSAFRDYIRAMTPHMTSARVGVLVVSAAQGDFEAGISVWGQTREHALVAHMLGVPHLLVLVNKLDALQYSAPRFEEIRTEMRRYLQGIGYPAEHVTYIPISSWTGENLIACSTAMPWYCGPNVLAALERVPADVSCTALPLRITVQEVFTVHNVGTVVVGRVESGVLRVLDHVLVMPGKHVAQISSIEQTYQRREQALPGEVIAFSVPGLSAKQVRRGSVVGHLLHCPPDEVVAFDAKIMVLAHPGEIHLGYSPLIVCHTARVACRLVEIHDNNYSPCVLDCETKPAFKPLTSLKRGSTALVRFVPTKPMVVECSLAPLNKIAGHDMRVTVLVGRIVQVYKKHHTI